MVPSVLVLWIHNAESLQAGGEFYADSVIRLDLVSFKKEGGQVSGMKLRVIGYQVLNGFGEGKSSLGVRSMEGHAEVGQDRLIPHFPEGLDDREEATFGIKRFGENLEGPGGAELTEGPRCF